MPIYEFYCPDNHKIYQFFARNSEQAKRIPLCPDNAEYRMVKKVSGFAIGQVEKKSVGEGGDDGPDMDDPKIMAAMAEMERAVSGMDEDNPDPRQMGKLMRQMADMTGEPLTGEMVEMVRKLEEGHDPEALEEQFGDLFGDEDGEGDPMSGMGGSDEGGGRSGNFRGPPLKDETLYDFD
ncbi:MAG: cytochrome C [Verrucomicrobia bacterium]|nr:cytochrome C [Verrucomicrobiota bacterium]